MTYMGPNESELAREVREHPLDPVPVEVEEPEEDVDGPSGIQVPPKNSSTKDDLVNTAQHALLATTSIENGTPRSSADDAVDAAGPSISGQPNADVTLTSNRQHAPDELSLEREPSAYPGISRPPKLTVESNVSDAAADVLVSLKEPQASVLAQVDGHERNRDDLGAAPSTGLNRAKPAGDEPAQALRTIQSTHPTARRLETGSGQKLPPLRSHLTQLAEVAEKESNQSLDGRTNKNAAQPAPLTSLRGVQNHSPPPSADGTRHDLSRPALKYMTTPEHQRLVETHQINGSYTASQTPSMSLYSKSSPQESLRQSQESTNSPLSPEPGYHGPSPHQHNRRPSQASENGGPYAPASLLESAYPPPSTANGNAVSETYPLSYMEPVQDRRSDPELGSHQSIKQHNGHLAGPGYKCLFPGCNARPFQTQYLLKYYPSFIRENQQIADLA